jgi:hypothetical protein
MTLLDDPIQALLEQEGLTAEEAVSFLQGESPASAEFLSGELNRGKFRKGSDAVRSAIILTALKKAIDSLNGKRDLYELIAEGTLAVALPIPPHIEHQVIDEIAPEHVYAAEDHLPPHLEEWDIEQLDVLLPNQVLQRFAGIKGILAEGRIRGGTVETRRSIVRILETLPKGTVTLYLHGMPHRPPHADFVNVGPDVEVIEIP